MKAEHFLQRENQILKQLLKHSFFWMNYTSTDCDGCSSQCAIKFTSLDDFYNYEENKAEWADGPFSFSLAPEREDGTFDLLESYSGGSWADY
jgi:hypothetical protein